MIGVDWGTTNARAFLIDERGDILERRQSDLGASRLQGDGFADALSSLTEGWVHLTDQPILLCGMVGGRQGWKEAPYVACPAAPRDIARAAVSVEGFSSAIKITPGVASTSASGIMEVMRGEEVQVCGGLGAGASGLVLTPGTHSKWIRVEGGRIVGFKTFMTGELFAVLKAHSILAQLMDGAEPDAAGFELGVRRSLQDPALTNLLFSVRTEGLFNAIAPKALSAYLSGLLIGAEMRAGLQFWGEPANAVTIVASPAVAEPYLSALRIAGATGVVVIDGAVAAARGLRRILDILQREGSL